MSIAKLTERLEEAEITTHRLQEELDQKPKAIWSELPEEMIHKISTLLDPSAFLRLWCTGRALHASLEYIKNATDARRLKWVAVPSPFTRSMDSRTLCRTPGYDCGGLCTVAAMPVLIPMDRRCSWRFRIVGTYHIGVTVRDPEHQRAVLWGLQFNRVQLQQCSYDAASGRDWRTITGDEMPVGYPDYEAGFAPRLTRLPGDEMPVWYPDYEAGFAARLSRLPRMSTKVGQTLTEVTLCMDNGVLFFGFNGGILQEAMRGFLPTARLHPYVGLWRAPSVATIDPPYLDLCNAHD